MPSIPRPSHPYYDSSEEEVYSESSDAEEARESPGLSESLLPRGLVGRVPEGLGYYPFYPRASGQVGDYSDGSQITIPLDDEEELEEVETEETWDFIEESYPQPQPTSSSRGDGHPFNRPMSFELDVTGQVSNVSFDDDDEVDNLSSDSVLDWDSQPFDFVAPFGHIPSEPYDFETRYPRMAPIIRHAMGFRIPSQEQIIEAVSIRGRRITEVYRHTTEQVEQVVRASEWCAASACGVGAVVAEGISRLGSEVSELVEAHWASLPNYVEAVRDGWREMMRSMQRRRRRRSWSPSEQHDSANRLQRRRTW